MNNPAVLALSLCLSILAGPGIAQETAPFALEHYGHFKKMMHMKKTDGVVDLAQATSRPHLYGVGAPAHGTGEITLVDGKLWLDYGADGLGNAVHDAKDELAVLLVTAEVTTWAEVVIPEDMSAAQYQVFILEQADAHGIDITKAFPFTLEGTYSDLDWHILDGLKKDGGGHGLGGLYNKIEEHLPQATGLVVGFYSAATQGVFTHPGESWHLHVVFQNEGKAGHVDSISVKQGAVLKLPVD